MSPCLVTLYIATIMPIVLSIYCI